MDRGGRATQDSCKRFRIILSPRSFRLPQVPDVHQVFLIPGRGIERNRLWQSPRRQLGLSADSVWQDFNANAERDPQEPGQGGVPVYADYNFNNVHDVGEPSTVSMDDIPETDFDEGGLYVLEARPGFTAIRQIVPANHVQTFPNSDAASPFEQGAHFVNIESGVEIAGLDFGNFPLDVPPGPLPGDLNGDGVVNREDFVYWEETYGATSIALDAAPGSNTTDGRSLLDWQRNLIPAPSVAAPALSAASAVGGVLPAVNLDGSPRGASGAEDAPQSRRAKIVARDAAFSEASPTALSPSQRRGASDSQDDSTSSAWSNRESAARRAAFGEVGRSISGELSVGGVMKTSRSLRAKW